MFKDKVENETRLLFHVAFKYFAVKLGLSQAEVEMINVEVEQAKQRMGNKLSNSCHGACEGKYLDGELQEVNIYVKDQSNMGIIETLAHEMVHAKQNLKGEFEWVEKEVPFLFFFKVAIRTRSHAGQILSETPYYEQKCEQEAFSKSREMTRQFLNFFNQLELSDETIFLKKETGLIDSLIHDHAQTEDDTVCN